MRDLPKRQSEHSWSEERASRLGYTGWDMLALGCNVLIGGRRNTGPPTLIPGGGRSFPTTNLNVENWDQRYMFKSWTTGRVDDPSVRSENTRAWEMNYCPALTRVNHEGIAQEEKGHCTLSKT